MLCHSYWDGVNRVKHMFAAWSSAARLVVRLDRVEDDSDDYSHDRYSLYIIRLFCQLSAMAMMRLHVDDTTSPTDWKQVCLPRATYPAMAA